MAHVGEELALGSRQKFGFGASGFARALCGLTLGVVGEAHDRPDHGSTLEHGMNGDGHRQRAAIGAPEGFGVVAQRLPLLRRRDEAAGC